VIEAIKNGTITKPVVAWAIGTCASMFKTEVQFGHAGASWMPASRMALFLVTAVSRSELAEAPA
jgi:succinyl-CoA synthetase alpha subunit